MQQGVTTFAAGYLGSESDRVAIAKNGINNFFVLQMQNLLGRSVQDTARGAKS